MTSAGFDGGSPFFYSNVVGLEKRNLKSVIFVRMATSIKSSYKWLIFHPLDTQTCNLRPVWVAEADNREAIHPWVNLMSASVLSSVALWSTSSDDPRGAISKQSMTFDCSFHKLATNKILLKCFPLWRFFPPQEGCKSHSEFRLSPTGP